MRCASSRTSTVGVGRSAASSSMVTSSRRALRNAASSLELSRCRVELDVEDGAEQGQPRTQGRRAVAHGLVEPLRERVVVGVAGDPEDLAQQAPEGKVRRRGLVLLARGGDGADVVAAPGAQLGHEPRLADTRLAHELDEDPHARRARARAASSACISPSRPTSGSRDSRCWRSPSARPTLAALTGSHLPLTRNGGSGSRSNVCASARAPPWSRGPDRAGPCP